MRILATIAFSFSGAVFAAVLLPWDGWQWYGCIVLVAAALIVLALKKPMRGLARLRLRLMLALLSAAAALAWYSIYCMIFAAPLAENYGQTLDFQATVVEYPVATNTGAKVTVSFGLGKKAVYYGGDDLLQLEPGQTVSGTAYWQNAGEIRENEITVFTSRGVHVLLYARGELNAGDGSRGSLRWLPQRTQKLLLEKIREIWKDEETAAFVSAMLIGERDGLSEEADTLMSETGLSHLFSVSGLHCTFLVTLLGFLIPPVRRRLFAVCAIAALLFYMLMVGMSPSVVRSCIMLVFVLLAPIFRRDSDPLTSLSAALMVILLVNPYAAAGVGLQLSFAATAGIFLCGEPLYRWMEKLPLTNKAARRGWCYFAASLSVTLGALALTVPLTAYYFNIFVLVSPLSNLLVVPAAGLAFMISFVTVLVGFFWLPAAQAAGWLVWLLIRYCLLLAKLLMAIPYHALYFSNRYLKYWLLYAYVMVIGCRITGDRPRKYALCGVLAALSLVLCVLLGRQDYRYGDLGAMILDVGQGESVVLYSEDEAVLVDCGSSNTYVDAGGCAADQLHSMGFYELKAVVVSHYHADHTNGLTELLSRIPVQTLYLPNIEDEYGVKDHLLEMAQHDDIDVVYVEELLDERLGKGSVRIYPPLGEGDLNEQGLTVLGSAEDFDLLITGDMASSTEKKLVERYALPDIEVLVVSHHGSRYSSNQQFLESVSPETAVISVGDNSYGHPSDAVLARLADLGIDVYRTDLQGNILLTVHKGEA